MLLTGTVVQDAGSVIEDGGVLTEGATIAAIGDAAELRERYPDH